MTTRDGNSFLIHPLAVPIANEAANLFNAGGTAAGIQDTINSYFYRLTNGSTVKMKFVEDGNLTGWACSILFIVGIGICYVTFKYLPPSIWSVLFALLGFGIAAVGGMCSRAHMLHIKPFDNSYKKARESYRTKDDEERSPT